MNLYESIVHVHIILQGVEVTTTRNQNPVQSEIQNIV